MKKQKGQTLIEALVALGVAVVVATAITIAAISALKTTEFNSNANLASQYAQEGVEFARSIAQEDWGKFHTYQDDYCYNDNTTGLTSKGSNSCSLSKATSFARVLTIDQTGGGQCNSSAYVLVTVSWRDGACVNTNNDPLYNYFCHNVKVETCLSSVNAVTLP